MLNLNNLFYQTKTLKFLNLSSFTIYNTTQINNFLGNTNATIILCYNESKMPENFIAKVSSFTNSCLKLCIMNSMKYILATEMCVDNCYSETVYKYEYQGICYSECPIRTQLKTDSAYLCEDCPNFYNYEYNGCIDTIPNGYYCNSTLDKTIDKCPEKCALCSSQSMNNNLCISCNIGNFYPKLDDESNIDSFIECYDKNEEQEGYYLDNEDNIYKKCYNKCKKCSEAGDNENNHCLECIEVNYIPDDNGNCKLECPIYFNYEKTSCLSSIPNGYYCNSTIDKTMDKCPEKCAICSSQSMNNNLCVSCNIVNFYPKLDDESNIGSFIECYDKNEEQEGYYLDSEGNIYKKCYNKCKKCSGEGDDENNHCLECNDVYYIPDANGNCKLECPNYYNYEKTSCLSSIPNGYYCNSTVEKTIDKCPEKCASCSSQSMNNNLCISCNIGNYYPKLDDESNINSFIECYDKNEEQEGYYLDRQENIYKKCYHKCKKCSEEGNNENNHCLECIEDQNYTLNNGNCLIINLYTSDISSSKIDNDEREENRYSYDINSVTEEAKNNISKVYIDIDPETLQLIKRTFSLNDDDKIFLTIIENNNNDPNSATSDYTYVYTLENGTVLNMSNIKEDIYVDVYVPITDLELAKFNLTKQFAEQGYDIYDINSNFYNDFCTPASMDGNDITLEDRKKDIYPQNITLCKSNCVYNGINIEEQRVICSCNLNSDKIINETKEMIEDDGNFLTYLLDNINYRIFKCYKLFFNSKNLKKSWAFFIILIIYFILLICDFIYTCYSLKKFKIIMARELFTNKIMKKEIMVESDKKSDIQKLNPPKKNKSKNNNKTRNINDSKETKNKLQSEKKISIYVLGDKFLKSPFSSEKSLNIKSNNKLNFQKSEKKNGNIDELLNKEITEEKSKEENINEMPFSKAVKVDNRNVFIIFYSIIIDKLDLISIFCYEYKIKSILFAEYIMGLLINFFFNALLYSDDVVSNKYHNNGQLDIIVSLTLSILSNIVTSIFCYYIKYSKGVGERVKLILEIRYQTHFYHNMKRLFLYLKLKFTCFFMSQIIIVGACMYYIVIFGIKYYYSQKSLIVNFLYSLVESIITSFGITLIIIITRKIGLSCSNKQLYNTSKYINSKF